MTYVYEVMRICDHEYIKNWLKTLLMSAIYARMDILYKVSSPPPPPAFPGIALVHALVAV